MRTLTHRRILIVDDEEADRMLLSAYLQRHNCRLFYAEDGLEGIDKARTVNPDLILMDSDMPRCSGIDACRIITQDPKTCDIPVIFISGLTWPEQRIRGLLAGAVDYINKPFDFDEVKLRLAIHLRTRAPKPEREEGPAGTVPSAKNRHVIVFHSARTHLLKSLSETPTMQELEKLTGTNSKHLNTAFRACAGVTVYQYLREERMKEARSLLQQTQLSVQDIALQIGFRDSANFATAFKDRFGFTPREFRQQHN
ncbi:DNA-binding response regulator [Marinobacter adhaerens]|uniref:DNA-binding response regulator n=1 Tax=Marinobacter adhaerens TaxID=1033846 RepID=A0A851HWI8_9GAMM|nr:DNA-binding response regulator [Marinobacter adhaerens]NWN91632.1 DNA-binding response regulator [Marinobacter adhaerens]